MNHEFKSEKPDPIEGFIPVGNARLYYRNIGLGQPIIILHGGPDFDINYLLPDMDRLSDSFRLIYYDQRGRGKSADHVKPGDISIASEINDLELLRAYFELGSTAILGHSWGGLLAMEYAIRHPERISHLILMNTAPASQEDYRLFRDERRRKLAGDVERLEELSSSAGYQLGDPETLAEYYRIYYGVTLKQPAQRDRLISQLRLSFTNEAILKARAIEDRLLSETWRSDGYNLLPSLKKLHISTLVIHGDYDFVPVECAERIAQIIPGARFVLLKDTGHFSYLENPDGVRRAIKRFFRGHE